MKGILSYATMTLLTASPSVADLVGRGTPVTSDLLTHISASCEPLPSDAQNVQNLGRYTTYNLPSPIPAQLLYALVIEGQPCHFLLETAHDPRLLQGVWLSTSASVSGTVAVIGDRPFLINLEVNQATLQRLIAERMEHCIREHSDDSSDSCAGFVQHDLWESATTLAWNAPNVSGFRYLGLIYGALALPDRVDLIPASQLAAIP